ncbi:MAG TPA: hypothetical protein VHZ33_30030 [Trebonia sp.]|nr:hypothetical protein [Trebonia sp.]
MSQWDFGYGREPAEHHEPQYPADAPFPYPERQEPEYGYAQEPQYTYPQQPQYQYPEGPYPQQPAGPAAAGYLPGTGEWPGDPGQPADPGWYDSAGYPSAGYPSDGYSSDTYPGATYPSDGGYEAPAAPYPITYERDGFEGRPSRPPAPAPGVPHASSPWPDAPDPTGRFGGSPPAREPWRPPLPAGEGDTAVSTRAWYQGQQPLYPGDPAYAGGGRPGEPRPRRGGRRARPEETWQADDEGWAADAAGWPQGAPPRPQPGGPWGRGDNAADADGDWDDDDDRGRWLIPAALAVAGAAVGAAIVMFALGHARAAAGTTSPSAPASSATSQAGPSGTGAAGSGSAPLTLAAARSVLAGYTSANNTANARRSAATLATVETGGSYAIDAGLYKIQAADGAAPYAAFSPAAATYYIPRAEPAGGPRWFAVKVANAFSANPGKVTSTEYLLFTQAAAGGAWQNAIEPYLLAGADAPQIAVGGDGLATAVSATATTLAVAPERLAGQTANAIDGTGTGVTVGDPGALADRSDQTFWRGKLPTATVSDAHTAATGADGATFALLTTDGGALVFYTDAAELAITPPAGSAIHLTVPGLYSPAQALSRAGLGYLDQFAADDPPAGSGTPRVVAEYSGLTGKN